jgi:hypothetical protein
MYNNDVKVRNHYIIPNILPLGHDLLLPFYKTLTFHPVLCTPTRIYTLDFRLKCAEHLIGLVRVCFLAHYWKNVCTFNVLHYTLHFSEMTIYPLCHSVFVSLSPRYVHIHLSAITIIRLTLLCAVLCVKYGNKRKTKEGLCENQIITDICIFQREMYRSRLLH